MDEAGEYDDWIELYNTTGDDINLAGLYLTDDMNDLLKWPLPDLVIPTNDYLIIWTDDDEEQGDLHANFKLSSGGEVIILADENGTLVDFVSFGENKRKMFLQEGYRTERALLSLCRRVLTRLIY